MPDAPDIVATLRQALAACASPWGFEPDRNDSDDHGWPIKAVIDTGRCRRYGWDDADAALAVAAVNALPGLLDELEAARGLIEAFAAYVETDNPTSADIGRLEAPAKAYDAARIANEARKSNG